MKRLIAFVLALGMLLSLCACGKTPAEESQPETVPAETAEETTAATEEPTEPENLTYAEEHGFQFVGASDPMDYRYLAPMRCSGLTDVEFDPEVWNYSAFRLVSAEPLADDPNYTVYTFSGVHTNAVKLSGVEDENHSCNWGTNSSTLLFVDANTGYQIYTTGNRGYYGDDHMESIADISAEGLLNSPSFLWEGEEIHLSLSRSGDSHESYKDYYVGDDGRAMADWSSQVEDKYILVAPTDYTGLCVGVRIPKNETDPNYVRPEETDGEAGNKMELFEPSENVYYYFRRLDEMAALLNDGVISGRTESGALTKSIKDDGEALANMPNVKANPDGTVQKYRRYCDNPSWKAVAAESEKTTSALWDKGLYDITVASRMQESFNEPEALRDNMCSVDVINRSKGLLVEIVAFDGDCNVVGRSGIIGPQEFLSGFPLDKIPETTFSSIHSVLYYMDEMDAWHIAEEPFAISNVTLGAYVYDLNGNFLYYELFSEIYCK